MIKKIHYVWLGGSEIPMSVHSCIKTWMHYLPDWEIIRWDENNFDVHRYSWVREAIEKKKYAFAADFIRLYVLYNYGGVYIDTDVQILKNVESCITSSFVCGLQIPHIISDNELFNRLSVQTGFMYSEKKHPFVLKAMEVIYENGNRHFCRADGILATIPIDIELMTILKDYFGVQLTDRTQKLNDGIIIYESSYFATRKSRNNNSYLIHWFDQSWVDNKCLLIRIKKYIKRRLYFIYRRL